MADLVVETGAARTITAARPDYFERIDATDTELTLAAPAAPGATTFRPNLVVTVTDADVAIEVASTRAMASVRSLAPAVHLVACDVVTDHPLGVGRRIEFVYPTPTSAVAVTQWIFVAAGHEIVATASRSPDQVLATDAVFDWVVATIRLCDG